MVGPNPQSHLDADEVDFIGRGIGWPLRVDHTGSIQMVGGADHLDQAIEVILMTAPGERVFRPAFGCAVWELLFEPINAKTLGAMEHAVRDAVGQWEPRVTVERVVADAVDAAEGHVRISIDYLVKSTNDRRNLVYPFYVIPHDGDDE